MYKTMTDNQTKWKNMMNTIIGDNAFFQSKVDRATIELRLLSRELKEKKKDYENINRKVNDAIEMLEELGMTLFTQSVDELDHFVDLFNRSAK